MQRAFLSFWDFTETEQISIRVKRMEQNGREQKCNLFFGWFANSKLNPSHSHRLQSQNFIPNLEGIACRTTIRTGCVFIHPTHHILGGWGRWRKWNQILHKWRKIQTKPLKKLIRYISCYCSLWLSRKNKHFGLIRNYFLSTCWKDKGLN